MRFAVHLAPLVLIPGMLCDARLWCDQTAVLEESRPVVIPDVSRADCLQQLARDLLANHLPERFVLGGLSMGGYLALEILRQLHEAEQSDRVEKLILIATSARADAPEQTRVRRGLIELTKRGRFKGVTPQLLPTLIHPSRVEDHAMTRVIFAMADDIGVEGFVAQETAVMNRRSQLEFLPEIAQPTLIICGDHDQRTPPECSDEMAQLIANNDYHLLKDCGHLPPMEQPAMVTALMQAFLDV
jgi:pimeloyl-ACP methyl ester carboxylesterase